MRVDLPPFQELVDAYWRDVARLATALAGPDGGDDVAQQAWTQALKAYPGLSDARNLRGWLLTITSRAAVDAHRGRSRRAVPVEVVPDVGIEGQEPSDAALWLEVRGLPERQRRAVVLRYVLDLTHAQVAEQLDTTPAASRRLVSDALRTLRSSVTTTYGQEPT